MPAASPKRTIEPSTELFVATETGCATIDGEEYSYKRGRTHVRAGHALLRACPQYFAPAEQRVDYDVETATAAPGERRA